MRDTFVDQVLAIVDRKLKTRNERALSQGDEAPPDARTESRAKVIAVPAR
jgi:hypothetical protein